MGGPALIAIGYTMVYGILRLINFAHGDIFMMAGYFMIFAMVSFPWYVAIPLVLIATVLLGVFIERAAYKPLRNAPRMSIMISAIGVSYLLQNLATYLFTALPRGFRVYLKKYSKSDAVCLLVTFITQCSAGLVYLLVFLINHSKVGMAMRAVSRDFETAQLMGIKISRVITITFAIGSLLAAVGSILYLRIAWRLPLQQALPGLNALCGSLGGIGNIPGAMVGGFILGLEKPPWLPWAIPLTTHLRLAFNIDAAHSAYRAVWRK